ncbi:MAG: nitroreductase family protein [Gallionellaceae bacterium]|nr:nitroreductase family protein [Gallionellaceae bacterium]
MKTMARTFIKCFPLPWEEKIMAWLRNSRDQIKLLRAYFHDWHIYRTQSGLFREHAAGVLEAKIIRSYHRLEKGLALPQPRPGFGQDAVYTTLQGVEKYIERFGPNHTTARALHTLREFIDFNRTNGMDMAWLEQRLTSLAVHHPVEITEGGTRQVSREAIMAAAQKDLSAFFSSRFSVRQFSNEAVSDELIRHAVAMAQKSPSVCNRESGRVFVATTAARKAALLELQNGNRGFGDSADRILVITSHMDSFLTVGERYQCWIDGGLFAMSLIYAFHSLGVGSCCLNWSVEPPTDQAFKKISGIPVDHAIIMLLAIGHLPPNLLVAQSPRRPLSEVLRFI